MFSLKYFFIVSHIETFVSHFFCCCFLLQCLDSHEKPLKPTCGLEFIFGFLLVKLCPSYTGINKRL